MTPQQRHRNMAAIRSKGTKPELVVRRWLWRHGFRYRLNSPRLPGHPDLVLRKYRTCIFVNGCFWHGHHVEMPEGELNMEDDGIRNSACCKIPHTNRDFWVAKIRRNQQRDIRDQQQLARMGWHCITVWECELAPKHRDATLAALGYTLNKLFLQDHSLPRPYAPIPEEQSWGMAAEERMP